MEYPQAPLANPIKSAQQVNSHDTTHSEADEASSNDIQGPISMRDTEFSVPMAAPTCDPDSRPQHAMQVAHRFRADDSRLDPPLQPPHGLRRDSGHTNRESVLFANPITEPGPGNIVTVERGEATKSKTKIRRRLSFFEDALQDELTRVMVHCLVDRPRKFIPEGQLTRLVTQQSIKRELLRHERTLKRRLKSVVLAPEAQNFELLSKKICGEVARSATTLSSTEKRLSQANKRQSQVGKEQPQVDKKPFREYRRIFTVLVLLDRPHKITSFIQADVCDDDLPLLRTSKQCSKLAASKFPQVPLDLFKTWTNSAIEKFEEKQWVVLAPIFKRLKGERYIHRPLHHSEILPFTSWKQTEARGGFGQLYRAEIHPDHHSFGNNNGSKCVYAVKELFTNVKQDFQHEIEILNSISCDKHTHPHLITLLATYEMKNTHYLIFPYAEADLLGYWEHKKPSPSKDCDTARWIAQQCCGLAEALCKIHRWETTSGNRLLHPQSIPPWRLDPPESVNRESGVPAPRQLYGRHGDIKPNNILWFDDGGRGVLKITDFGIAHFSTKHSVDAESRNWIANSPIYRAPERDFPGLKLSPSWDIWALGCVYLEFITWYFGGWKGIDKFAKDRLAKDIKYDHNFKTITFFTIEEESGKPRARVKESVSEKIRNLSAQENGNQFFRDFLALIKDDMLVVESHLEQGQMGRKTAHTISTKLSGMVLKCKEEQGYI